jgi:hypothetical protein
VIAADPLDTDEPEQLRQMLRAARAELAFKQAFIDKLTHENAVLKRLKFAAQSEAFTPEQKSLLDETFDMDLAAVMARSASPSGHRCRLTCHVRTSTTSPPARRASAAAR